MNFRQCFIAILYLISPILLIIVLLLFPDNQPNSFNKNEAIVASILFVYSILLFYSTRKTPKQSEVKIKQYIKIIILAIPISVNTLFSFFPDTYQTEVSSYATRPITSPWWSREKSFSVYGFPAESYIDFHETFNQDAKNMFIINGVLFNIFFLLISCRVFYRASIITIQYIQHRKQTRLA